MKGEKDIKKIKLRKINLSRCYRFFIFSMMISIDSTIDISDGIFSSASKEIKKKLNINNTKFGSFSTSTSVGKIMGSFLFILINQNISRKWLLTICIFLNSIFLFNFKITQNVNILIIFYGLLGITKTIPTIYIPVWINQFGHKKYKTIQITSVQLFQSIGKIIGYIINLILGHENWQNGFLISGSCLMFLSICCFISNENYFSKTLFPKKLENNFENNKKLENRISSTIFEEHEIQKKIDDKKNQKINFLSEFSLLFQNKTYIISLICGSIIRGLITCLNYWFPDFLRDIINKKKEELTICYSIIILAEPVGGIITNGYLIQYIGSYENKKSSWPIVFLQLIASIFAVNIGLMKSLFSVCTITICYLIFNSSILAFIQGIIISSVDKNLSATGFAYANVFKQIIIGPTPIIYGIINDKVKDKYQWLPMCCIMSINFLAMPFLIWLAILRNKKIDEEEKIKENKNEEELIEKENA